MGAGNIYAPKIEGASFSMTNRGLQIELPCLSFPDSSKRLLALLNCYYGSGETLKRGRVGIILEPCGDGRYRRSHPHVIQGVGPGEIVKAEMESLCVMAHHAQDQEMGLSIATYGISFSISPSVLARFAVERIAKWCPVFEGGQFSHINGPIDLEVVDFYTFAPYDYAGLLLNSSCRVRCRACWAGNRW